MTGNNDVALKKWHLMLGIVFTVGVPTVSLTGAYYQNQAYAQEMVTKVDKRISEVELDVERRFVKKDEIKELAEGVKTLLTDVADIKGYLRSKKKD